MRCRLLLVADSGRFPGRIRETSNVFGLMGVGPPWTPSSHCQATVSHALAILWRCTDKLVQHARKHLIGTVLLHWIFPRRSAIIKCSVLSLCLIALGGCPEQSNDTGQTTVSTNPPSSPAAANMWVVAWGASQENAISSPVNPGGSEQTFRSFFYPTLAGGTERVRFSNYFGTTPITIGAARLAIAAIPPAIDPSHDVALSFNGNSSVTIAPGAEIMSDPVNVTYAFGQKLAVTAYVKGTFPALSQHQSQVVENYNSPVNSGDVTTDALGTVINTANTEYFLISGMDVYGQYQGTFALFGSSTIDGHNSNFGNSNSYPTFNTPIPSQDNDAPSDALARNLNAAGFRVGVLNAGIVGEVAGPSSGSPSGSPGVDRIGRDALNQPGVKTVVIDLGSVDLRGSACGDAAEVEASLQNMVAQAHAAGVGVILGTITPATYCTNKNSPNYGPSPVNNADPFAGDINPGPRNPGNVQRQIVNTWIKTTGVNLPGVIGVADFETALAGPDHPDFLIPNLNSGDNFHPNGPGYQVKVNAIPVSSLAR